MDTLDLQFVNGSAPALSADNMNAIVSKINAEVMSINNLNSKYADMEDKVDEVISGVVPEAVVKEAVDDYVEEHSGGFATEAEVESLNESLNTKENVTRTMTKAQFDALTTEQKKGNIIVSDESFTTDIINDSVTSSSKTWSSNKLNNAFSNRVIDWSNGQNVATFNSASNKFTVPREGFVRLKSKNATQGNRCAMFVSDYSNSEPFALADGNGQNAGISFVPVYYGLQFYVINGGGEATFYPIKLS